MRRKARSWRKMSRKFGLVGARKNWWSDDSMGHSRAAHKGWSKRKHRKHAKRARRPGIFAGLGRSPKLNPGWGAPLFLSNKRGGRRGHGYKRNPVGAAMSGAFANAKGVLSLGNLPYAAVGGAAMVGGWWLTNLLLPKIKMANTGIVGFIGNVVVTAAMTGLTSVVVKNPKVIASVAAGGMAGAFGRLILEQFLMPQGMSGINLSFAPDASGTGLGALPGGVRAAIDAATRRELARRTGVGEYAVTGPRLGEYVQASPMSNAFEAEGTNLLDESSSDEDL